jgi:hypothetical protein
VLVSVLVSVELIVIVLPDCDIEDAPEAARVIVPVFCEPDTPTEVTVLVSVLVSVEDIVIVFPLLDTEVAPPPLNIIASPADMFAFAPH